MMRISAVVAIVPGVAEPELRDWIARGWVMPDGDPPDWMFGAQDVARVRVVRALRHDADLAVDHLALVLSLLDRVGELRDRLARLDVALTDQPPPVRAAIEALLRR